MPWSPAPLCSVAGCAGRAAMRGRCERHRQTNAERGYGATHQADRKAALPGARCEACGCASNLQRDHRVPVSMGGTDDPSNKRWLCRCREHGCHDRVGARRDRPRVMA